MHFQDEVTPLFFLQKEALRSERVKINRKTTVKIRFKIILQLKTTIFFLKGMDPVVRQVGQHLKTEPEWEAAFKLHITLASVVPPFIKWCASDRVVLIKAYRMLLTTLGEVCSEESKDSNNHIFQELLDYSVSCIDYDVSKRPVSIHSPLTRLLAGLTLELHKQNLNYNSMELNVPGKPSLEELIETVMRTRVLASQVSGGMWRRNGTSLGHQIYLYHNVICRQEMYDRDIMLLQIVASLMDSNIFLIHLLDKFKLLTWLKDDFEEKDEDVLKHTVYLAEEYLHLILVLIAERHNPGIGKVTKDEKIKKEIIQLLCIKPMEHSVLNKALLEGSSEESGIEAVIDEVATFIKPTNEPKGKFQLKPEYYSQYNPFFYHYTREEQSKSEVSQRLRKKNANEEEFCPPPKPPAFTEHFDLLVNIIQCDVFLHIIKTVLNRLAEAENTSVTELQLQIVLHLIGYALHEEERYQKNDDPYFHFTCRSKKINILGLLEVLIDKPNSKTTGHKDLLTWTINRYHEISQLRGDTGARPKVFKPSRSTSSTGSGLVSEEKQSRAELAHKRRNKIMERMNNMQKKFIKAHQTSSEVSNFLLH